jgi:hypothetical protein
MDVEKMKGQVFILLSLLILILLLSLREETGPIIRKEVPIFNSFSNLKEKLIETVELSLLNEESISHNLEDFINLSKNLFKEKGYLFDANYSISSIGKNRIILLNISLSYKDSYLKTGLIINRTVYS